MDLLALAVHGELRQRLEVLPAVERAEPADAGHVEHVKMAAVAFAEHGSLHMGGLELAPGEQHLSVSAEYELGHIQRAVVLLAGPHHHGDLIAGGSLSQAVEPGVTDDDRVGVVLGDEPHSHRLGVEPQEVRIARDPQLRKGDQPGAMGGGLRDQGGCLLDSRVGVEPAWLGLYSRHLVRSISAHSQLSLRWRARSTGSGSAF